jgi:lipoprotein NlpD
MLGRRFKWSWRGSGLGRSLLAGMLIGALAGCSYNTYAPVRDRTTSIQTTPGIHVVQRGETLFSIAWQYGLDSQTLAAWNRIGPPYTIYPGQKIGLNPPAGRVQAMPTRPPASPQPGAPARKPPVSPPTVAAPPKPPGAKPPSVAAGPIRWQWPAAGPVLRPFAGEASGKKGISIGGAPGGEVRAAAGGNVVYAGGGLVGYGQLIILKHNDTFLSAYGHNRNLLVTEGDEVRAGQVIAQMGSSGTNRTQLHFEIRRNGKPVDPLGYLPRR